MSHRLNKKIKGKQQNEAVHEIKCNDDNLLRDFKALTSTDKTHKIFQFLKCCPQSTLNYIKEFGGSQTK
nr:8931_t:CDS:2 [Entrophospora candida]